MIKNILQPLISDYKAALGDKQYQQLQAYFELLVEWNEKMNLTAITDPQGVAVKHFADCLTFFNCIEVEQGSRVIDVGTGAGFPGVVLKIARPDINLTLLDSLNKRLMFLDEVLTRLGLEAELVHSRAEDGAKNTSHREAYDFAVSRAVARLNILSEYCLPYVKQGGSFIAMKGPDGESELLEAKNAMAQLGGGVKAVHSFSLPGNGGTRTIVEIAKLNHTPPKYPRVSAKIKSKPL